MSDTNLAGGCLCGAVRIALSGAPYRVGICHCLDCRKHHGAVFHTSAIFPVDAVTISGALDAIATPRAANRMGTEDAIMAGAEGRKQAMSHRERTGRPNGFQNQDFCGRPWPWT